jgi:hypothetical protein
MMRRYHYVREGVENKQHALIWITTTAQVADMGSKNTFNHKYYGLSDLCLCCKAQQETTSHIFTY